MSLKEKDLLIGHEARVWNVSWHPEGKILATCGADKSIRLWSESEGQSQISLMFLIIQL